MENKKQKIINDNKPKNINKSNEVQIPFSMRIENLKNRIINDINSSGLPIYIAEYVIDDIVKDVKITSNQIKQQEKSMYEQQLKQSIQEKR